MNASARVRNLGWVRASVAFSVCAATALTLAGCGASNPRVAASVDGDTFSTDQVQSVIKDWNGSAIASTNGKVTGAQIVQEFIVGHFALAKDLAAGKGISLDSARTALVSAKLTNPSDATVRFVQLVLATNAAYPSSNGGPTTAQVGALTKGAKIWVNPRYGTYDRTTGKVSDTAPSWISSGSASAPASAGP